MRYKIDWPRPLVFLYTQGDFFDFDMFEELVMVSIQELGHDGGDLTLANMLDEFNHLTHDQIDYIFNTVTLANKQIMRAYPNFEIVRLEEDAIIIQEIKER